MKDLVAVWVSAHWQEHDIGPDHPDIPGRVEACLRAVALSKVRQVQATRLATADELGWVHGPEFVQRILASRGTWDAIDHETLLGPGSVLAALGAAGCALDLVEQVVRGEIVRGVALTRPPGHHAERERASGYCIFNNVALAARAAQRLGARRIAIVDLDVHHGNGTEDVFREDPEVLVIDLHQRGLFPEETGKWGASLDGFGGSVPVPLAAGCGIREYLTVLEEVATPILRRHAPDVILVSLGFDAHVGDPLGGMKLETEDFGVLAGWAVDMAEEMCGGRLAMFLEGGYALEAVEESMGAVLGALLVTRQVP
jgi:acetoin utilization deacetylase AcuC-like enzyme